MRTATDLVQHVQKPEYRQALQELIKYELQALVERLSETGEEAVILTASLQNGTSTQLASPKAEGFLIKQKTLGSEFLSYFNDDGGNSSGDDLCTYEEDIDLETSSSLLPNLKSTSQYGANNDNVHTKKEKSPVTRTRERTTPRRMSLSREDKKAGDMYEVSQTSDLSASERNDSASSVSSFVEAHEQDNNTNSLQCKICVRTFRSYKTLNSHIRKHMVKSYKCNFCGKIFSLKSSYQRHIKSHNKNKVFDCGFCDKSFADQLSWKQHRERHFGARNFSCNLCGKAFYEKYSLKVHQTSHFISTQRTDRNLDSNTGYSCHICQKFSKTKAALKNHILTHSAKKHACEFCNKRFSLKYSYIRHRRIHTGEKPYKCGSCGKQFSDSSAWAKHVRTHSGIKPYCCDICDKSFYDKTACKTHVKAHQTRMGKQIQPEKRNFEMMSDKIINEDFSDDLLKDTFKEPVVAERKFESHTRDNKMFVQLSLPLDESDKELDSSNLLDSGFGQDLMVNEEKTESDITEHVTKNTRPPILDNVELDETFQKEFVERNMPIKGIESDSELISTTFPDEAELLDETESENQSQSNKKSDTFGLQTSQDKSLVSSSEPTSPLLRKSTRKPGNKRSGKWVPESPSKCKKCRKVFKQDSLLKQHLQFHCMMKLYKCRYCGKQLSTKNSLVRHERIHVGERPYQCYICQKTFADNYGCIRHVKQHFNNDNENFTTFRISRNSIKVSPQERSKLSSSDEQVKDDNVNIDINKYADNLSVFQEAHCQEQKKTNTDIISKSIALEPQNTDTENMSSNLAQPQVGAICRNNVQESNKSLFRCYNCAALFPTQKDCIDHIQQNCNKNIKTEFISVPHESNGHQIKRDPQQLKSIYQCSVCKMMFNEEDACRAHQAQGCHKQDKSSECPVQSLLQETLEYPSPNKNDTDHLPSLPFPDISSEQSLLDINGDVMLLSNEYQDSILPDTQLDVSTPIKNPSPVRAGNTTFLPFDPVPILSNTSSNIDFTSTADSETSPLRAEFSFTGLVPKSVTVSQGKYVVTSQGLSLFSTAKISPVLASPPETTSQCDVEPLMSIKSDQLPLVPSVEPKIGDRTCTMCNKVFTNKHILKQHVLIHMERKFGCKYCLKKFHNKYGRDRHERIHTGEKPYSCPKCRKAFSDNSTYRKHTRVCCAGK